MFVKEAIYVGMGLGKAVVKPSKVLQRIVRPRPLQWRAAGSSCSPFLGRTSRSSRPRSLGRSGPGLRTRESPCCPGSRTTRTETRM